MQKFNNHELKRQIIELVEKTTIPCSIDYVATNIGIAWGTARAILLDLAIDQKIQLRKTTKGLIFWVNREGDSDTD